MSTSQPQFVVTTIRASLGNKGMLIPGRTSSLCTSVDLDCPQTEALFTPNQPIEGILAPLTKRFLTIWRAIFMDQRMVGVTFAEKAFLVHLLVSINASEPILPPTRRRAPFDAL